MNTIGTTHTPQHHGGRDTLGQAFHVISYDSKHICTDTIGMDDVVKQFGGRDEAEKQGIMPFPCYEYQSPGTKVLWPSPHIG